MSVPRIGVIHATPLSLAPISEAMDTEFPTADVRHVLDDSLLKDLRAAGALTEDLERRMERVIAHLLADDIDALQFACSGYVPVVDRAASRLTIPVRKPDEAMYRELADAGHDHVGILATVQPALDLAAHQLQQLLDARSISTVITTRCVPEAMDAAQLGDGLELTRMLTGAVDELSNAGAAVVAFAQYSMSPVAQTIARHTGVPVVTGPRAAARDLRQALGA
jgi:aspartate/glutamate racemase